MICPKCKQRTFIKRIGYDNRIECYNCGHIDLTTVVQKDVNYITKGDAVLLEVLHPEEDCDYRYVYAGLFTHTITDEDLEECRKYGSKPIVYAKPQDFVFGVLDLCAVPVDEIDMESIQQKRVFKVIKKRGFAWVLRAKVELPQ